MCSFYRSHIIKDNVEEWVSQTMFGIPQTFGDDRRLTAIALRYGRTVINPQAICETIVPETISNFLKQQVRWNKSFFKETFIFIKGFGIISKPKNCLFWRLLLEGSIYPSRKYTFIKKCIFDM